MTDPGTKTTPDRLLSPRLMLCPVGTAEVTAAAAARGYAADPPPEDLSGGWLIERQRDGRVVGLVAAETSLTCVVDADCRRRGYATEALVRLALEDRLPGRLARPGSVAARGLLAKIGYRPERDSGQLAADELAAQARVIQGAWRADYQRRMRDHHRRLGIAPDYGERHGLQPVAEASSLRAIGPDRYGREQFLSPPAAAAWEQMHAAAARDAVVLEAVSAYRRLDYQAALLERKLERGEAIEQILEVSAAPGFSQHHSGLALDLGTADSPPLEEAFEATPAFAWLVRRAAEFGFRLSYPRDNPHGIAYEPWHWAFSGD